MNASAASATIRLYGQVLICSPDAAAGQRLALIVRDHASETTIVTTLAEAARHLEETPCDVCLVDEPSHSSQLAELDRVARSRHQPTQFIVLPAIGQRQALAAGLPASCDLMEPPLTREKLHGALFSALGRARIIAENDQLKRRLITRGGDDMVGQGPAMRELRQEIQQHSEHRQPVLIQGEAGSGTNVVARALHRARFGGQRPVVRIHCRVLSGNAIEQEVFGTTPEAGDARLLQAAGGTLVLDDVDTIPLPVQERLVRYLSSVVQPAEGDETTPAPACIVATTHVDLRKAVQEGRFRADLLQLLSVHSLKAPALRDRTEDIGLLAEHCLSEYATREGKPAQKLSADAIDYLKGHHWPGNVRELNNVLERCSAIHLGAIITGEMVAPWVEKPLSDDAAEPGLTLREMERKLIEATFTRYGGNRELTARALQIGLRTLSGKLREYGYPPRGGPGSNRRHELRAA